MGLLTGAVMMFIAIIIGLTLVDTAADTISTTTDTYTNTGSFSLINGTPVAINSSGNSLVGVDSVVQGANTLTLTTHYTVDTTAGTVNLTGTVYDTGTYNVTFDYTTDSYIDDDSTRSITGLVTIFFVLAVVFGSIMFIDWKSFGFN